MSRRVRASLLEDEVAGLELENLQLRRHLSGLEAKIKRCSIAPQNETPETVEVKKQLVALEAQQESESGEEDLKSDKILRGMIASRNWRRFAQTLRHLDRENEMDEIEVENAELKEKMRHMEESIKQVKADNKKLQHQMQEDIRIQNRYKDAQKQLENAQMETDLQRSRVADMKEMLEHMELEMSFAKLDVRPKDQDLKANRPEFDAPRVGRVSVEEEADHIFKQLQQQGPFGHGSNQLVSPEFISRSVRLIKKNLLLQRKMSGLLEWRSEATVNKLQLDLSGKVQVAEAAPSQPAQTGGKESELRNLVQDLQETLASEHLKFSELQRQHLGYAELKLTHGKMKDEMVSQEQQNRKHAKLEMEAKVEADMVRRELQMKSSELVSASRALQEMKRRHVGVQDQANLLEQSYVQLRSEHQSSESMLAALQEEHQVQQRKLQKLAATTSTSSSDRAEVVTIGQRYAELQSTHQKVKDEMMSQEHQNREYARVESEAKAQEDSVRKELQMKTSEVASANRALQEAKQQLVGTQDRADLLEQSYVQLRSEHQSSESMLAALQEEHQVQQRQLQKLAATTSTSSSDRAEVVAIGQRYAELQLAHQKIKDELVSQEHQNREFARLESEAKAREDTVRTELQMKTSEVASANRALQEAKQQNHSESEVSSTSPVSFKDSVFLATKGPETASQGAGMAALRRARASLASQASPKSDVLESPGAPESGLKATMAALKLRAMAKATPPASPASLASPAASTPPSAAAPQEAAAKSPAVLAAHRAKASTLLLKALKTASNEPG